MACSDLNFLNNPVQCAMLKEMKTYAFQNKKTYNKEHQKGLLMKEKLSLYTEKIVQKKL